MILSLAEVTAMAKTAARGSGYAVGQAEDLGQVARYLAGTGGDLTAVTRALQELLTPIAVTWDEGQLTIQSGPAILIAPVVRDAFVMGYACAMLADMAHCTLVGAYLAQAGFAQVWDGLLVQPGDTTLLRPRPGPVTVPDGNWQIWSELAARTHVPESQRSLQGAGAGVRDND